MKPRRRAAGWRRDTQYQQERGIIYAQISSCGSCRGRDRDAGRGQDGSGYVGIEGGVLFPQKPGRRRHVDFTDSASVTDFASTDVARVKYKTGYDVDLIGGYDFGMFRLEGELGYKRAKAKSRPARRCLRHRLQHRCRHDLLDRRRLRPRRPRPACFRAWSTALLDFGGNGGVGGYVGGGVGYASVKQFGDSDSGFAWQLLAGVYAPVSDNIDVGLKYRYFRTGKLNASMTFAVHRRRRRDLRRARRARRYRDVRQRQPLHLAQPAREPGLQLRRRGRGSAASASAAASAAGSGDADLPGRLGDPGDERLPGPPPPPPPPVRRVERG